MEFSVATDGLTDFGLRFRAVRDYREEILDAMNNAAEDAVAYAQFNIPYRSGEASRAIGKTPVKYLPGGVGGGGTYEVLVGVDRDKAPHVRFLLYGSGIYSQDGPGGNVNIDPGNVITGGRGNVMVFTTDIGEKVFTMWTRGQRPRDAWWIGAIEIADSIIREKIRRT
jgi:hypothetical protein